MYTATAISLSVLAGLSGLMILYAAGLLQKRGDEYFLDACRTEQARDQVATELEATQAERRRALHAGELARAALKQTRVKIRTVRQNRNQVEAQLRHLESQLTRDGRRHHTDFMVWFFDDLSAILLDLKIELNLLNERAIPQLVRVGVPAEIVDYLRQFYRYGSARLESGSEMVRTSRVHPCAYRPKPTGSRPCRPGILVNNRTL